MRYFAPRDRIVFRGAAASDALFAEEATNAVCVAKDKADAVAGYAAYMKTTIE